jgi:hypothetical protein
LKYLRVRYFPHAIIEHLIGFAEILVAKLLRGLNPRSRQLELEFFPRGRRLLTGNPKMKRKAERHEA